jgi:hypothetical protein
MMGLFNSRKQLNWLGLADNGFFDTPVPSSVQYELSCGSIMHGTPRSGQTDKMAVTHRQTAEKAAREDRFPRASIRYSQCRSKSR